MTAATILMLSGPNLSLFGVRSPKIYGTATLSDYVGDADAQATTHGMTLEHIQSEHEGDLVAAVHNARGRVDAVIVNAGALSHYGWSLRDALAAFDGPIVELHVSNPNAREPWRHTSVVSEVASGTVAGFGRLGYRLAVDAVAGMLTAPAK